MNQPLFFEPSVSFEKSASEVMLPEDANDWPNEIMQELFKQVSFISDFEPHVVMDRVDAERGYGFGHIEVSNKTEIQTGASPDATSAAGVKSARIPIVIKDRKLQPLDLVVTTDSKIMPLTEARLRQVIFRPQIFDITGRGPGDMSMIGQLYPPYRQNYGMGAGGGMTTSAGMGKEGSARGSLLAAILPTIEEGHYNAFVEKIASDTGLRAQYIANGPATSAALNTLGQFAPVETDKLASAGISNVKPSIVQLRKESSGYTLKTASHRCWSPEERRVDRGEAVRLLGEKVVLAADLSGSTTMTAEEGVAEGTESAGTEQPELVNRFGMYKVQDENGKHLVGFIFPNLIDVDGTVLPLALFTNGSQRAVQGEIAGIDIGTGASLFEGPPRGTGVFYRIENGNAEATIVLTVKATLASPEQGGVILHAETFDGREAQVIVQPNLQAITPSPDGDHLLIPDSFSWLPLDEAEETALVSDPGGFAKEAQAARTLATVQLRCGGSDSFSIDGFAVDKLASDERHFLSLDNTMFLLGGLGADLDYVQQKIGQASAFSAPISVRVGHHIQTAGDLVEESLKTASTNLAALPDLRRDLTKEASVIPDPVAVDSVLSLGFMNRENLGIFISYMSSIDDAQMRLCELLLAARLGLRDIPVNSLEKSIHATEEVLEGLHVLAFQKT